MHAASDQQTGHVVAPLSGVEGALDLTILHHFSRFTLFWSLGGVPAKHGAGQKTRCSPHSHKLRATKFKPPLTSMQNRPSISCFAWTSFAVLPRCHVAPASGFRLFAGRGQPRDSFRPKCSVCGSLAVKTEGFRLQPPTNQLLYFAWICQSQEASQYLPPHWMLNQVRFYPTLSFAEKVVGFEHTEIEDVFIGPLAEPPATVVALVCACQGRGFVL